MMMKIERQFANEEVSRDQVEGISRKIGAIMCFL
jgi:hypothetical protein